MRIGVLTGGGDAPGLNAVIRAIVRKGVDHYGHVVIGFKDGWRGPLESDTNELTIDSIRGILHTGGTILGTSRTNPYRAEGGAARVIESLRAHNIEALIPIGGEDTLSVAAKLAGEGVNIVGVPKTIDNDLPGTDYTFGFDTAVQIATEAIDRLHTTAESHHRIIVVEVMGRNTGWIATYAGIAGGGDIILIPEQPFDLEEVTRRIRLRMARGRTFSIVVVAEGAVPKDGDLRTRARQKVDEFGHAQLGGIGTLLAEELEERTGYETRVTILGHVQRGGTPTAFDRVLATRFGVAAVDAVHRREFGVMVALRGPDVVTVSLDEASQGQKTVDERVYDVARVFFG